MSEVCVDASMILAWLLPAEESLQIANLIEGWIRQKVELVAPPLLYAEVTSVLREAVFFKRISSEEGETAFAIFCALGVKVPHIPDLHRRAWDLAKTFNRPKAYDSHYVAVSDARGCPLWTVDKKMFNAFHDRWPRMMYAGVKEG